MRCEPTSDPGRRDPGAPSRPTLKPRWTLALKHPRLPTSPFLSSYIPLADHVTMARGIEGNEIATPRTAPKKTGGSTQKSGGKQQSIAGFFKRTPGPAPPSAAPQAKVSTFDPVPTETQSSADATPVPSSLPAPSSSPQPALESSQTDPTDNGRNKENGELQTIERLKL